MSKARKDPKKKRGIGRVTIDLLLASAKGEAVEDTDTGCAFYTLENIDTPEIADNLYD